MKEIKLGATYTLETTVEESLLASHVGSGIVDVYATPMMIALMEKTATLCLDSYLDEGETSVGVMINTTHDAATPSGMDVQATAEIIAVEHKKVTFRIVAKDECDTIGVAKHERFIVVKDKFEARAKTKAKKD